MLSTIAAGTVRRQRLILGVGIGLAVACPWIGLAMPPMSLIGSVFMVLPLVLGMASSVLALVFTQWSRPWMFAVDTRARAFRTMSGTRNVYLAVGLVLLLASQVAMALDSAGRDPSLDDPEPRVMAWMSAVSIGLSAIAATGWVVGVWRGALDVRLRPDGLVCGELFGSLTVPWEALAPGYPRLRSLSAGWLTLTYTRPELVRRRGLTFGRRWISADAVDPRFLGAAIAYYVAYPRCRAAIGTQAEHDRLVRALTGRRPVRPAAAGA
ncbi:hypothetical protein ACNTMW_11650 [Planosporangium sp. 12N6]|uniref:hypothetical protein n=1 Tax=Planosporangium spinosum TaxID=3402278 RepID=UPI003CF69C95